MNWWPFGKKNQLPMGRNPVPAAPVFPRKTTPLQQRRVKVTPSSSFRGNAVAVKEDTQAFRIRAILAMVMLTGIFATMAGRLIYVATKPPAEPRISIRAMPAEPLRRGNIYDRNGVLLAATVQVYSLYADPSRILDPQEAVKKLHALFPDLSHDWLQNALSNKERRFIWLKRRLPPKTAADVIALGIPGLAFRDEYVRIYPHRNLASHILGAVDVDNNGLAGVERNYNDDLKKGYNLDLAIDVRLQDMLRQSVSDMTEKAGAKAGWGVVMAAKTGEILALTSIPDYDPNHFGKYPDEARFNRAALASYEMGSTFKIFTLAHGLAEGVITPSSTIDCRFPITIGKYTIKDFHGKKAILTATEVLRYSSNIGAIKIADMSGPESQRAFLSKLGMLEPLNVGLAEVGRIRYPSNWGRVQTFTISYGHGLMVTPLHVVAAAGAIVTDGLYRTPHILKGNVIDAEPRRILSPTTVDQVRYLMRDVVTSGTGKRAGVPGYDVGGKTGTAEKISGRGYSSDKNIVSFIGALPLNNPDYIILIMLDEPKKGYETAGLSAAPAVGEFIRRFVLTTGVKPDMTQLMVYKTSKRKNINYGTSMVPLDNDGDAPGPAIPDAPLNDIPDDH